MLQKNSSNWKECLKFMQNLCSLWQIKQKVIAMFNVLNNALQMTCYKYLQADKGIIPTGYTEANKVSILTAEFNVSSNPRTSIILCLVGSSGTLHNIIIMTNIWKLNLEETGCSREAMSSVNIILWGSSHSWNLSFTGMKWTHVLNRSMRSHNADRISPLAIIVSSFSPKKTQLF